MTSDELDFADALHGSGVADIAQPEQVLRDLDLVIAGDDSLGRALHRIASLLVMAVPTVDAASVTLYCDGQARTAAFTDRMAAALDERQYHLGVGPCLQAARTGERVVLDCSPSPPPISRPNDTADAATFAAFIDEARRVGVRSVTALPLGEVTGTEPSTPPVRTRAGAKMSRLIGVLNTYTSGDVPLAGEHLVLAESFVSRAQTALAAAVTYATAVRDVEDMQKALTSRAQIEQAKGALVALLRVDPEAAFTQLRWRSSHTNRKLRDVAADVVAAAQEGRLRAHPDGPDLWSL